MVLMIGVLSEALYFERQNGWDAATQQMVLIYKDGVFPTLRLRSAHDKDKGFSEPKAKHKSD